MNGSESFGRIVWSEAACENDRSGRILLDEVTGEGPVEGFSGAAVVLPGRSVDEESEVFSGEFVVGEVCGRDGPDERDLALKEVVNVFESFISVELHGVDEAFIDEVGSEGAGIVHEDTDADNVACDVRRDEGGVLGGAVAFGFRPEVESESGYAEFRQTGGVFQGGDATYLEGSCGREEFGNHGGKKVSVKNVGWKPWRIFYIKKACWIEFRNLRCARHMVWPSKKGCRVRIAVNAWSCRVKCRREGSRGASHAAIASGKEAC